MCEFLEGDDLSQKIRDVVKGKNARCAVAFWGRDAVSELFGTDVLERDDVHVVCDLSMGGTNPNTLRALGAPRNEKIKHHDGLHAKVFLSDKGAVVGSANASNNGIGFMGDNAQLLEAGTYFAPDSDGCRRIGGWFTGLSENGSRQVDDEALNAAQLAWNRRRNAGGRRNAQDQDDFLNYDPDVHGLVLVCWYEGGGNQKMDDPRIADAGNSYMYFSDDRDLILDHWICAFGVDRDGNPMNGKPSNPYFFFATDYVIDAAQSDEYHPHLCYQATGANVLSSPFNFDPRILSAAFSTIIARPDYDRLRDAHNENPWLVTNHIRSMHRFWRDVQAEYRRLQAEA